LPDPRLLSRCLLAGLLLGGPALAFTPDFPGTAVVTANLQEALTSYRLPTGPLTAGVVPARDLEGAFDQTSWRITMPGLTTLALLAPLRDQLRAEGWTILFECETEGCGGFDFRYGTDVMPEPDMHVDLGDFRFLSAERQAAGGPEYLSLMISRSTESGFVQLVRLGAELPEAAAPPPDPLIPVSPVPTPPVAPVTPVAAAPDDLATGLETGGAIALDDLVFPSGESALADGDYASLGAIAAYLAANPTRQIALVGHTDASGSLATNVALSRKRAASVRDRLIKVLGVDPAQVQAEGVGYLSPRASNLTEAGRTANRRVEVMLTSTQ
jgi:outer membrane protein OmpA-like peptidoglycan-associated protein